MVPINFLRSGHAKKICLVLTEESGWYYSSDIVVVRHSSS